MYISSYHPQREVDELALTIWAKTGVNKRKAYIMARLRLGVSNNKDQ